MNWHWDERKAKANLVKHGISFQLARLVFDDPMQFIYPDEHFDDDRWKTIGMVDHKTLIVIHTIYIDDDGGRIISARKATPHERKIYETRRND